MRGGEEGLFNMAHNILQQGAAANQMQLNNLQTKITWKCRSCPVASQAIPAYPSAIHRELSKENSNFTNV